jgi:ABC-2 type transport system permease protein
LRSYFVSPVGYVALALWLCGVGFFFAWIVMQTKQASMQDWFGTAQVLLLFVGPALTMRLLADEQSTGTLELLMTAPVRSWEVVVGKFIGAALFWLTMLGATFFYPVILKVFGNPDIGPIFSAYLGLYLMGAAFLAIGVFTSSLTSSQVIAYIMAFVALLILYVIASFAPNVGNEQVSNVLTALSVTSRFADFARGVVDSANILFYLSVIAGALFATVQILEARRARQ